MFHHGPVVRLEIELVEPTLHHGSLVGVELRVPIIDPDRLPTDMTFGLRRLVHDELERVRGLLRGDTALDPHKALRLVRAAQAPLAGTEDHLHLGRALMDLRSA